MLIKEFRNVRHAGDNLFKTPETGLNYLISFVNE